MDDEEIAAIIAQEALRRKERARHSGVLSYMDPLPTAASVNVNKRFLTGMIASVAGHNRRNQEEQCYFLQLIILKC